MTIQEDIRMKGNVKTNEWKERTGHGRVRVWGREESGWVVLYFSLEEGGEAEGEGEGGIMGCLSCSRGWLTDLTEMLAML